MEEFLSFLENSWFFFFKTTLDQRDLSSYKFYHLLYFEKKYTVYLSNVLREIVVIFINDMNFRTEKCMHDGGIVYSPLSCLPTGGKWRHSDLK